MGIPTADAERFDRAIQRFDEANAKDPNVEMHEGSVCPRELLYARRLTGWVLRLDPKASEELRLAARSQHICRWEIPRENYPMTRAGYLKWRQDLKHFHAKIAGEILKREGYPPGTIEKVRKLNLKLDLRDPETQTLEDALCLVFLEFQFGALAEKLPQEKVITAVQKSWQKMSDRARSLALGLTLNKTECDLLSKALSQ